MTSKVTIFKEGKNKWQNNRYDYLSKFNQRAGISDFAKSENGNYYYHLISKDKKLYNFLNEERIFNEARNRFDESKAGDWNRLVTNTVASQPCCFNLFAPLKFPEYGFITNKLISELLEKIVNVKNIIIEFTPRKEESLCDQSKFGGTDADVAVFYDFENSGGVILIEFKYIEAEFSRCTSYRVKEGIRKKCDNDFYDALISGNINNEPKPGKPNCGYLKYNNWQLLRDSKVFDFENIKKLKTCPFRYSLNQLWRNMLLAENVAKKRKLDEFHFWVIYPKENTFLWENYGDNVEESFKEILTEKGKKAFRKLELDKDVVSVIEKYVNDDWSREWMRKFREKYLTGTEIKCDY
jgi:hypothetical protein